MSAILLASLALAGCPQNKWEQAILDKHNEWRAATQPAAKDMYKLRWDSTIANNIKKWIGRCDSNWPHSDQDRDRKNVGGYEYLGENLAYCAGSSCEALIDGVVGYLGQSWWDEKNDYDWYGDRSTGGVTSHYTQMSSSNIYAIGCAAVECPSPGPWGWNGKWWEIGCQYGERGQGYWVGTKPFLQGSGGLIEPAQSLLDKHPDICVDPNGPSPPAATPAPASPPTPPSGGGGGGGGGGSGGPNCPKNKWEQAILDKHNEWRAATQPAAKDMYNLRWDSAIADNIKKWIGRCDSNWPHSDQDRDRKNVGGYEYLGENLAYCAGSSCEALIDGVVGYLGQSWWDEKNDYDWYGDRSTGGVTSHYTQMSSSNIYAIGCAAVECPSPGPWGWNGKWWEIGCQYGERGQGYWVGTKPFLQGSGGLIEPAKSLLDKHPNICTGAEDDECDKTPCGSDQTCNDPDKSSSDNYVCTCKADTAIKTTGQQAVCTKDECASSPCGKGQKCNDPNKGAKKLHDFVCTCDADSSMTKIDGPATCTKDECAASPCGTGQTCADPDQSPSSLKDFTCTCANGVKATGASATCEVDECATTPCGKGQKCNDPNKAKTSQHDFVCTCDSDSSITKIDGPATCSKDECAAKPCDMGQTCADPNPSPSSLKDFTCTCANGVKATGVSATCEKDECAATPAPCGTGQTCNDPNKAANMLHDFICTCDSDSSITKIDGPATCTKDECALPPCGSGQTCDDPNQSAKSLKDFTCTCANGVTATGASASCEKDECAATPSPCGSGQKCTDPQKGANSLGDFTCTCDNDASLTKVGLRVPMCVDDECTSKPCATGQTCTDPNTSAKVTGDFKCKCATGSIEKVGGPAVCSTGADDECAATPNPCGTQTCVDPNQAADSKKDFVCTCKTGKGSATGAAATCTVDECETAPCGAGQACADKNTGAASSGDYECTCVAPKVGAKTTGKPATCATDECAATPAPCASGQTCTDPDTSMSLDYTCTCANGAKATGASATCEVDECANDPCGSTQTCNDPDKSFLKQHDFVCTCKSDASISKVDGRASCSTDECEDKPCAAGQTCVDPVKTRSSTQDYTCTCANGAKATGGAATCEVDECAKDPCGSTQTCNDPDKSYLKQHDFVCTCKDDTTITSVDGPATCSRDECERKPCADGQTCADPTLDKTKTGDYTCTCANGAKATGGPATCELDECAARPCGAGQLCKDPDKSYLVQHDFVCTCAAEPSIKQTDGPARCSKDECAGNDTCGEQQACVDPAKSASSIGDWTCTCLNDATKVEVAHAVAACGMDECESSPCGAGQLCIDTDYLVGQSYQCSCPGTGRGAKQQGGPVPSCDECSTNPCGAGQTCTDLNPAATSVNDFMCKCTNGNQATGAPAQCNDAQCAGNPCGPSQMCKAQGDTFACTCTTPLSEGAVGKPAVCVYDECKLNADACAKGQMCSDPDTSPQVTGDFVCTCQTSQGVQMVGSKVGGHASCRPAGGNGVDECAAKVSTWTAACGRDQLCEDKDRKVSNDYVCTCRGDATIQSVGAAASCPKLQSSAATPEQDDTSDSKWWIWLLVGLGVLGVCAIGAVVAIRKRNPVKVTDFLEMNEPGSDRGLNEFDDGSSDPLSSFSPLNGPRLVETMEV